MLNFIKNIMSKVEDDEKYSNLNEKRILIATCVLLIEMAKADEEFSLDEEKTIRLIIEKDLKLEPKDAEQLMSIAKKEQEEATDFWEYAKEINATYNHEEKIKVIEMVWKVVYADGVLDKYEDYLIHKLGYVLHLDHKELIDAKIKIKKSL